MLPRPHRAAFSLGGRPVFAALVDEGREALALDLPGDAAHALAAPDLRSAVASARKMRAHAGCDECAVDWLHEGCAAPGMLHCQW